MKNIRADIEKQLEKYPLLLKTKEAAEIFRTDKRGVYKLAKEGKIAQIKQENRMLYSKLSIIDYVERISKQSDN